jgi:AraC family ethanolamine operon transcriptional activator
MSIRKPQEIEKEASFGSDGPLFPGGLVLDVATNNFDDMAIAAPGWDQEYLKLGKEAFRGHLLAVHTARVQIGLISWNPGILIHGSAPPHAVTLALVLAKEGRTSCQGTELKEDSIVLFRPGMEFEFSAVGGCKVLVVVVEQALLQDHLAARCGNQLLVSDSRDRLSVKTPSHQSSMRRSWEMLLVDFEQKPGLLMDRRAAHDFEHEVLDQLLNNAQPESGHHAEPHRHRVARKAKDYLIEHVADTVSIGELCETVQANERTLLLGFHEVFGMSPKLYQKSLRLNRVRQDLLRAGKKARVTDIAVRWGFSHLSRFAADYRQMFGERPRETARR